MTNLSFCISFSSFSEISKRPKTGCGKELRELVLRLKDSAEEEFTKKYNELKERYKEFWKKEMSQENSNTKGLDQHLMASKGNYHISLPLRNFPI